MILIIDSGWNSWLAERLGSAGLDVAYWSPWERPFPLIEEGAIGAGLDGVTRWLSPFQEPDDVERVISLDLSTAHLTVPYADAGVPVWGVTPAIRSLETDRANLPGASPAAGRIAVTGLTALAAVLDKLPEAWVKLGGGWRGMMETCRVTNRVEKDLLLATLRRHAGPLAERLEAIVERPVQGSEVGLDMIWQGDAPLLPLVRGYEAKDSVYVGVMSMGPEGLILPPAPGYWGFLSTEERVWMGDSHVLDITTRVPAPPGICLTANLTNLVEVVQAQADSLSYRKPFMAELILKQSYGEKVWLPYTSKNQGALSGVSFRGALKQDGIYWIAPTANSEYIGSAWGLGDTWEEAVERAESAAEGAHGPDLNYASMPGALMQEKIQEGEAVGISFEAP